MLSYFWIVAFDKANIYIAPYFKFVIEILNTVFLILSIMLTNVLITSHQMIKNSLSYLISLHQL